MPASAARLSHGKRNAPWVALDLGASKIAVAYCRNGTTVRHQADLAPGTPASSWTWLEATLHRWAAATGPAAICVAAIAPSADSDGVITHWPMRAGWIGRNIRQLFSNATGAEKVVLLDDGAAAALAECRAGRYDSAVVLAVGTGLASGVMVDGELFLGSGRGGQIGHMIAYRPGVWCPCGQRGCLQTRLSGPAMLTVARRHKGSHVTWPQWAAAWVAERRWASRAAAAVGAELAVAAANVTAIFDVPVAIFTGRPFETFPELVLCAMNASRLISPRRDAFIRPGRLGAGAALSGAAVLASELARL